MNKTALLLTFDPVLSVVLLDGRCFCLTLAFNRIILPNQIPHPPVLPGQPRAMSTTVASVCTDEDVTSVHVCLSKEGSGLINMTMVTMSKVVKNLEFFRDERHHHHHHHHRHHRHRLVDRLKRLSKRFGTFGSLLEMDESEDGCNDVVSLTEAAGAAASLEYQQASEMRPLRVSLGVNQPAGRGHMRQRRYGSTIGKLPKLPMKRLKSPNSP